MLVGVRPSVPAGVLLVVDRPLPLRETPAPFTSRSPDIATLGSSWTPSWQLGMYGCCFNKVLNEVSSRRCTGHQVYSLGWSPDGQLSMCCDLPTRFWFRYISAPKAEVIRSGSWLVRDVGGTRTHFACVIGRCLAIRLPRYPMFSSGMEPDLRASCTRV